MLFFLIASIQFWMNARKEQKISYKTNKEHNNRKATLLGLPMGLGFSSQKEWKNNYKAI
jgi:hypothetical protein